MQHLQARRTSLESTGQRVRPHAGLWELFVTNFWIGIQSFGGGSATLLLIRQACLDRGWLNEMEFTRDWALVQVAPGLNLIKLTALIGFELRGGQGVAAAAGGLVLPAAAVTALMTAVYAAVRDVPAVQAAMRGLVPATIGLSIAIAAQIGLPLLGLARRESRSRLASHLLIMAGAALLLGAAGLSPALVLLIAGAGTVLILAILPSSLRRKP